MVDYREDLRWTVYIHIVPKELSGYNNDKYYVGITSYDKTIKRWHSDGSGYKSQTHFWRAIEKYGWENIQHEIIAENLTKAEACNMEITLISKLQSNNKNYGYNKTLGGEGSKGHVCSETEKRRKSIMYSGENNPYYGKKHNEETRNRMSLNHADVFGGNNPRARKIYQFDLEWNYINNYPSARDAARKLKCCDGMGVAAIHHKKFKNFYWCFEDNVIIDNNGLVEVKEKFYFENKSVKQVYQFDCDKQFINVYPSLCEAEKATNISRKRIGYAARNKYKSGGYIWRYKKDVKESENISGSFILLD